MKCQRKGCEKHAVVLPVVVATAAGFAPSPQTTLRCPVGLPHCEDCRESVPAAEIIDACWPAISGTLARLGRQKPDRRGAGLEWVGLGTAEAREVMRHRM